MKKIISIVTLGMALSAVAFGADFSVDQTHSHVGFKIRHMFSNVPGEFKDFEGAFAFDPAKMEASHVEFKAQTASVYTNNAKRDEHLRGADFFDVEKFKTVEFKSTKVTPAGKDKFKLEGNLTMHGVTKPVTFEVSYMGTDKDPWGGTRAGFSAVTKLNRKDFGISFNKALDSGKLLLGEEVEVQIDVEGLQKEAAKK